MMLVRAKVLISGRVQGVFYRQKTLEAALAKGVRGWIRNRPDGRVEAEFEGRKTDVHTLIDWCRQGPPAAQVDELEVEWAEPTGEFSSFEVRHRAP